MTGVGSAFILTAAAGIYALNTEAASLTLDAGRAPFATLTLTVPYTAALAAGLDPRNKVRVSGTLRQTFTDPNNGLYLISAAFPVPKTLADISAAFPVPKTLADISAAFGRPLLGSVFRTDRVRTFDLTLRTRDVQAERGVIVLTATSDETLLQDYSLLAGASQSPGQLTVDAALRMVFATVLPGTTMSWASITGAVITSDAAVWQPGESAWTYITSLLTPYGFRLWCDEQRVWHVGTVDEFIITALYTLADVVNVKDAQDAVSRDLEWYDGVIVVYTWTDVSNVRHVQYDYASSTGSPSKVLTVNVDRPYPGAGEAAARLRKVLTRGHQVRVDVSPDLTPYPSQFTTLTLTGAAPLFGYTESITWTVPDETMTVTASDVHE